MSELPSNTVIQFNPNKKAEFVVSDRAKEIMERKPNATIDEVITKHG